MKDTLDEMYKQRYAAQQYGERVCACFGECEAKRFLLEHSFICNRSARVGNRYEQTKTRVVFIGKEDISTHRKTDAPASFCKEKNQHYVGTKHILAALLGKCSVDAITNHKSKEQHFDGEDTLHEEFALTNHYHCAFRENNNHHGVKTTSKMWDNCASIVRYELEILRPHIVIVQAGWSAKERISSQKRVDWIKAYFDAEKWSVSEDNKVYGIYIARNTETEDVCYIIGSYHPSFARWNQDEYLLPLKNRILRVRELINVAAE